jgi:hypothetical protein
MIIFDDIHGLVHCVSNVGQFEERIGGSWQSVTRWRTPCSWGWSTVKVTGIAFITGDDVRVTCLLCLVGGISDGP